MAGKYKETADGIAALVKTLVSAFADLLDAKEADKAKIAELEAKTAELEAKIAEAPEPEDLSSLEETQSELQALADQLAAAPVVAPEPEVELPSVPPVPTVPPIDPTAPTPIPAIPVPEAGGVVIDGSPVPPVTIPEAPADSAI